MEARKSTPEVTLSRRSSLANVMGGQWTDGDAEAGTDVETSTAEDSRSSPVVE
jgi:hypothetical protein